ncbi:MAG: hypothetical protein JWO94_3638 [Verrucomicrobiaceae bacterium]|nr:hypothetical protein [Verrucomicrobiaceae bacterium]
MHSTPSTPCLRLKVFIVENHEDTLRALQRYLEVKGYQVITATSVAEALAAIPASGCHVLLSDLGLADGTGWELLETLLQTAPLYAIAMSGYGTAADRARSEKAGFQHHLLKPFCLKELRAILQRQNDNLLAMEGA